MLEAKLNSSVKRPARLALLTFLVMAIVFVIAPLQAAVGDNVSAVSFQAGDGWKITGTLYLPDNVSAPVPAVVLLTEPGWVDRSIYDNYLSRKLAKNGMAANQISRTGCKRDTAECRVRVAE